MTLSRERRLVNGVWTSVTVDETGGGGGGSLTEIVADDDSVVVSNGTGPVVGLSADIPFVGVDPPGSPTDGMLWWDPDDDTPASGSQTVEKIEIPWTFETTGFAAGVVVAEIGDGDTIFRESYLSVTTALDNGAFITFYPDGSVVPDGEALIQVGPGGTDAPYVPGFNAPLAVFAGGPVIGDGTAIAAKFTDGLNGPGTPSQGAGKLVLFIARASA